MPTTTLVKFEAAKRALAEARSIDEVKKVRDQAEALRLYVRQQGESQELQNDIAEIKLRAERRAGELLREMEKNQGGNPNLLHDETSCPPKLDNLGISRTQSHRWQTEAAIPEEIFVQYVAGKKADNREITSVGLYQLGKKLKRQEQAQERKEKAPSPGTYKENGSTVIIGDARNMDLAKFTDAPFGVIIADPPWPYRVERGEGIASDQYSTMTDEELRAMPVAQLAKPDSILLLWATWPKLPEALQLMAAWGFEYVTGFPWVKTTTNNLKKTPISEITLSYGVGYWVRGCSECILIGRRGKVSAPRLDGFLGIVSPNFQHSRKPDDVHTIAHALDGPYLELFARRSTPGFTVFGNEIQGQFA